MRRRVEKQLTVDNHIIVVVEPVLIIECVIVTFSYDHSGSVSGGFDHRGKLLVTSSQIS